MESSNVPHVPYTTSTDGDTNRQLMFVTTQHAEHVINQVIENMQANLHDKHDYNLELLAVVVQIITPIEEKLMKIPQEVSDDNLVIVTVPKKRSEMKEVIDISSGNNTEYSEDVIEKSTTKTESEKEGAEAEVKEDDDNMGQQDVSIQNKEVEANSVQEEFKDIKEKEAPIYTRKRKRG